MSAGENLITSWIENGLDWKWVYAPTKSVVTIPANGQVLYNEHRHPEGALTHGIAAFDSPYCGIGVVCDSLDLDTGSTQTISTTLIGGGSRVNVVAWASVPPTTSSGVYVSQLVRAVPWIDKIEFWFYNTDSLPHRFLIGGYTLAVLLKKRPEWATGKIHHMQLEATLEQNRLLRELLEREGNP